MMMMARLGLVWAATLALPSVVEALWVCATDADNAVSPDNVGIGGELLADRAKGTKAAE